MTETHFTFVLSRIFATCMVITDLKEESQQGNSCYKTIASYFLWKKERRVVLWKINLQEKALIPSINDTFWYKKKKKKYSGGFPVHIT